MLNLKYRNPGFYAKHYGFQATPTHFKYHFFNNKKVSWWLERLEIDSNILENVLPYAIKDLVSKSVIDETEATTLTKMLNSSDKESVTLALTIIVRQKKLLRGKNKK